ncbi:choline transporter [Marinobacterium nitratireducens]|uniref:Choline transporter n=1 Tax=Marinobacterium nitratireducens TaxID=518897 RepID=A0A917ZQ09_9GAMM|nr:BCCT family transporter [Marinobacterium nitratireducens]GGO89238.1 choline transporter [Marinobacterium nitratireducens]
MNNVLSIAILATLLASVLILVRWGKQRCQGEMPTSLFAFMAILFTSGLDVGLVMFPLTEFPVYEQEGAYAFTNPLAIEFGFWGFLVWAFYFLTTFYFVIVEPRLKLFEIPLIKLINNIVIIGTCAFTGFLFLSYLPDYAEGISQPVRYGLTGLVVLMAVFSSSDVRYVKWLSIASTWLFFGLIALLATDAGMGAAAFSGTLSQLSGYFGNLHRFVTPLSDYHAFYLFWWFSWSIMIGQFVARFVGGLTARQLCLAMLVIPSIPIAIWFSVLYYYHEQALLMSSTFKLAMLVVGVIFVVNSLDSLIRLYTTNLNITVERFGLLPYILGNWLLMFGLVLLFQFTPLKIEWIGLVVIALYAMVSLLMLRNLPRLRGEVA